MRIRSDHNLRRVYPDTITRPSTVVILSRNISKLDWLPVKIVKKHHPHVSAFIDCDKKIVSSTLHTPDVVDDRVVVTQMLYFDETADLIS